MPRGPSQDIPRADLGGRVSPRFWHRLIRFRHFIDGSLALASLNLACQDHVPAFPQRSPPSLLTTAARGGLRSTPDCRPRRALLHLSYSCISPCGPAILVTHDPERKSSFLIRSPRRRSQAVKAARRGPAPWLLQRAGSTVSNMCERWCRELPMRLRFWLAYFCWVEQPSMTHFSNQEHHGRHIYDHPQRHPRRSAAAR